MIISNIVGYVLNMSNNITKTMLIAIEFIGGIKLYG